MPEVIFNGPAGRLEGRFHPARKRNAPIALVLHLHPQFGGTMNNQIVYQMYYMFARRGFAVRTYGRSRLLDCRIFLRCLDRHAASDAPTGSGRIHFGCPAGEPA